MGRFQPPDKAGTKFTIFQWFARVGCPSMGGATRACRCLGRLDAAAAECHVRTHDAPPIADEAVRIARSSRVLVAAALVALAVAAAVLAPDPAVWLEASRDVTGWTERNRGLGAGLFLAFATLGQVTPVPGGVEIGRATRRERGGQYVVISGVAVSFKKKNNKKR